MRFRLPGDAEAQLRKVLSSGRACLALFAAADALKLGFVQGVPPYVYVERIQPSSLAAWKNLRPCEPGESPDVVHAPGAGPAVGVSRDGQGGRSVPRPTSSRYGWMWPHIPPRGARAGGPDPQARARPDHHKVSVTWKTPHPSRGLIDALRPWLGHLVIVGGWAHRLHRLHPLAGEPAHPTVTNARRGLCALARTRRSPGDISEALDAAGFNRTFLGEDAPPVTHYSLDDDVAASTRSSWCRSRGARSGATGSATSRCRRRASPRRSSGISTCCSMPRGPCTLARTRRSARPSSADRPAAEPRQLHRPEAADPRKATSNKKAQDVLYIHDTLELFGGATGRTARGVDRSGAADDAGKDREAAREARALALFEQVTDTIREAARIPQDRTLTRSRARDVRVRLG